MHVCLLDIVILLTIVPLKKTVDIILKCVYIDKEITTSFMKRSLKKLILDTCQRNFSHLMVKCTDGFRGQSNIIMTK